MKNKFLTVFFMASFLAMLAVSLAGVALAESDYRETTGNCSTHYPIGAILPLTGNLSSIGRQVKAGLELAEKHVNAAYRDNGRWTRVDLIIRDDGSSPINSSRQTAELGDMGVKYFVGPLSSEACYLTKDYADNNGTLLLSPTATAASLSQADNLMRMTISDTNQAQALADHVLAQGVTRLAVFTQMDIYSRGLLEAFATAFQSGGGSFMAAYNMRGVGSESNFRMFLDDCNQVVKDNEAGNSGDGQTYQLDQMGVLVICFEQGIDLMTYAGDYPELLNIHWFGTDSLALNAEILSTEHPRAAGFAATTGFTCPVMSGFNSAEYRQVKKIIEDRLGEPVSAYALMAYDAFRLLARTRDKVGNDVAEAKAYLAGTAGPEYGGPTGPVLFDQYGDRANHLAYDFWQAQTDGTDGYTWVQVDTWNAE